MSCDVCKASSAEAKAARNALGLASCHRLKHNKIKLVTQTRFQIISIYLLSLGLVLAVLFWRMDKAQTEEALRSSELHARSQLSMLSHSSQKDLKLWSDRLVSLYRESSRGQDHENTSVFLAWSKTDIGEGGMWMIEKTYTPTVEQDVLTALMTLLTKSVSKPQDIAVGRSELIAFIDSERKPQFVLAYRANSQSLYMGLVSADVFQAMMDQQKGQLSHASLVNDQGQVLGHTISEYVGTSFKSDVLVGEIVQQQQASGSGTFKNFEGESTLGFYERVSDTNVYAVLTIPMANIIKNRQALKFQFLFLALGLALFGTGVIVFLTSPKKPEISEPVAEPKTGVPALKYFIKSEAPAKEPEAQKLMQSFVQELKAPIASILAQTKIVKERISSEAEKRELEWVEKQAREAHQLIQEVDGKSVTRPVPVRASLVLVLEKVLKTFQNQFDAKGIQVKKEFATLPTFVFDVEKLEKTFSNIVKNSIEAMERAPFKELSIRTFVQNNQIRIEIKDSGLGMTAAEALRALNPFYTTKEKDGHVGLGLSTALRNVKEYLGDILISSREGRGTTVAVVFPTTEALRVKSTEPKEAPVINSSALKETLDVIDSFVEEEIKPIPPLITNTKPLAKIDKKTPEVVVEEFYRPSKLEKFQVQIRKPGERI